MTVTLSPWREEMIPTVYALLREERELSDIHSHGGEKP